MKATYDRIRIGHLRVLTLAECKTLPIDMLQSYYDNHAGFRTLGFSGSKDDTLKDQNDYMDDVKAILDERTEDPQTETDAA